jgi:hypothetical protein
MSQIPPYRGKQRPRYNLPPDVPVAEVQTVKYFNPVTRQHELRFNVNPINPPAPKAAPPPAPKAAPKKLPPPLLLLPPPPPRSPSSSSSRSPSRSPSPPRSRSRSRSPSPFLFNPPSRSRSRSRSRSPSPFLFNPPSHSRSPSPSRSRSRSRSPSPFLFNPPSPSRSRSPSPPRSPPPPRPRSVKSGPKNSSIAQFEVVVPQIPKAVARKQGNASEQRLQELAEAAARRQAYLQNRPPPPTKTIKALPEKRAVYQQETQYKKKDGSDGKKVTGPKFVLGKTKNGDVIKKTVPDRNIKSTPERPLYVKARPQNIEVPRPATVKNEPRPQNNEVPRPSNVENVPRPQNNEVPRPRRPNFKIVPRRQVKQ